MPDTWLGRLTSLPGKIAHEFTEPTSVLRTSTLLNLPSKLAHEVSEPTSVLRTSAVVTLPGKVVHEFVSSDSVLRAALGEGMELTAAGTTVAGNMVRAGVDTLRSVAVSALEGSTCGTSTSGGGGKSCAGSALAYAEAAEEDRERESEGGVVRHLPTYLVPQHGAGVCIVGGGPVGLFLALQLKLLRPLWAISVLERHHTYTRSHVLRLHATSFAQAPSHPEMSALLSRLLGSKQSVSVRTTDLERAFRTLACALGVELVSGVTVGGLPIMGADGGNGDLNEKRGRGEVLWLTPPPTSTPQGGGGVTPPPPPPSNPVLVAGENAVTTARATHLLSRSCVIVGADGARSLVRRTLFPTAKVPSTGCAFADSLAHTLMLKYECQGGTRRLDMAHSLSLFRAMGFVGEEYVGRERGGKTPVTLTLVVDAAIHEACKGGTMANPLRLIQSSGGGGGGGGGGDMSPQPPLPPPLKQALTLWLNAKAEFVGEVRVGGSETLTSVNLSVYGAPTAVAYAAQVVQEHASLPPREHTGVLLKPQPQPQPHLQAQMSGGEWVDVEVGEAPPPPPTLPHRVFALCGDAAFGVPYFRALNNGLECASSLATALSSHGEAGGNAWRCPSRPLDLYAAFVCEKVASEVAEARVKRSVMWVAQRTAALAHGIPVGYVLLSSAQLERLRRPLEGGGGGEGGGEGVGGGGVASDAPIQKQAVREEEEEEAVRVAAEEEQIASDRLAGIKTG